jgi:dTDP-4-dehydrorhamnose reductase
MKSILITGAFGQLGIACSNILESTFNIIKTGINANRDNSKLDVSSKKDVEIFLDLHKPDIILNLAALTDVDGCEQDPERADKINREGVMHLCDGFSGHFIQLSTD